MTTKKNLASCRSNEVDDGHEYATRMEVSTENTKRKDPFSLVKKRNS